MVDREAARPLGIYELGIYGISDLSIDKRYRIIAKPKFLLDIDIMLLD